MPRQAPWKGNNMADGLTTLTHWWVYFLILAEHIAGLRVKNEVHRRNKSADIFYNCVFFMTGRFTGSGPRTVTELVRKVFVNIGLIISYFLSTQYHKQLVYWCRQLSYSPLSLISVYLKECNALIDSEYWFDKISCGFL